MSSAHSHCCAIDAAFAAGWDEQIHFAQATSLPPADIPALQWQARARVLRWFARTGILDRTDARDMAG